MKDFANRNKSVCPIRTEMTIMPLYKFYGFLER